MALFFAGGPKGNSRQDWLDNVAVDVRESIVAPLEFIGQFLVVEAE